MDANFVGIGSVEASAAAAPVAGARIVYLS
jgi:hypothetical protein